MLIIRYVKSPAFDGWHLHICTFTCIENCSPLSLAFCLLNHPQPSIFCLLETILSQWTFSEEEKQKTGCRSIKRKSKNLTVDLSKYICHQINYRNHIRSYADIIWNFFWEMQFVQFKRTFTFNFNKMTSPKLTKIQSRAKKIVVLMFFASRPIIYHIVSWSNLKLISDMLPYDEAVGKWMNEIFIDSQKSENQNYKNENWKPYITDKLQEEIHNKIRQCVESI